MAMTKLGPGLRAELDGETLVLKIKLSAKGRNSASGKSKVLAKTDQRVQWLDELGKEYSNVGLILNCFRTKNKPKKTKKKRKK